MYSEVDSKAMDHYLSSSLSVVDLGLVVHEQHVPDEGDFAFSQRSVREWLQEYLNVNYELISHAVEDRVFTQVRGMCSYELLSHAMEDRVVTQVQGMCYCLAQRLHRSVGGLQFYIHRENGLGKVIVDTLISTDGGFDHIRITSQSECEICDMGWQVKRGIDISQKRTKLLVASNVPECKPLSFPMVVSEKHSALDDELIDALGVWELGGSLE